MTNVHDLSTYRHHRKSVMAQEFRDKAEMESITALQGLLKSLTDVEIALRLLHADQRHNLQLEMESVARRVARLRAVCGRVRFWNK